MKRNLDDVVETKDPNEIDLDVEQRPLKIAKTQLESKIELKDKGKKFSYV